MFHEIVLAKPARNGHAAIVGIVCRVFGCFGQKEAGPVEQAGQGNVLVIAVFMNGEIELHTIPEKAGGMGPEREELWRVEQILRRGILDLLVVEDLCRNVRGADAVWLLGIAVEHGTRVISSADDIDTDAKSWEADVLTACKRYERYSAYLNERLKLKLHGRGSASGGASARGMYGYVIPALARSYGEWTKDPLSEPILREAYRLLVEGLSCSKVAARLNSQQVPVGPHCRRGKWSGAMVRRLFKNPILKGKVGRGCFHNANQNDATPSVTVPKRDDSEVHDLPHLAFFTEEEHDHLNAMLSERNSRFRRLRG